MKTINSKKQCKINDDIQLFIDQKTNKQNGIAGYVNLYDSEIYIDTRNGTGYDKVINKLGPLIYKLTMKYHFNGNSIEDTKHNIIVHILEGIPKYNPERNAKLSTFLEMRVDRRLINDLRDCSRASKNATFLNIGTYQIECECGASFVTTVSNKCLSEYECKECGRPLNEATKQILINVPEVTESMLSPNRFYEDFMEVHAGFPRMINNSKAIDESAIFAHDLKKWLANEDPRVVKIIKLYCFQDYSIKAASEKVGLSGAGGNIKLKELAKNPYIREILGR